jgi:leucyl aminopeptidase
MKIDVQTAAPLEFETQCLIIPLWQDEELSGVAAALNEKTDDLIAELNDDGFQAKAGETRVLYTKSQIAAPRVVLVGLGKKAKFAAQPLRVAAAKAARVARDFKRTALAMVAPTGAALNEEETTAAMVEGVLLGLHSFTDFKTDDETKNRTTVESFTLLVEGDQEVAQSGARRGQQLAEASIRARGWVNTPSNRKSPQYLASQAEEIARANGLRCEVWDENKIQSERMGALYAVGMGSDNPPRFIILEYSAPGHEHHAPLVLVGKGMTYDTGGYSLKSSPNMEDMKDDMGGAAVVLATMEAIGKAKPARRVIGLVPTAENMVNGHAQRPGDIVTARNGKTIEVLNTDAEGRLILADALSYACELKPAAIIDFATLTGAIGVALGSEAAGLFANDDELAARVIAAGEKSGDRVWRMPLWEDYKERIKSFNADIKNVAAERRAGAIVAAVFLQHFVKDEIPWAHVDIAASAYTRNQEPLTAKGATGFGVRLALELLEA